MLEERYKSLGLEPAGTQGFLQPFSLITGAKLVGNNHLHEQVGDVSKELKLNDDFVPFSFSASGEAARAGRVCRLRSVGRANSVTTITPESTCKGKIVVMLRYEPPGFAARSGNQGLTQHAAVITKAINARNHGAKAVVIVNGKLGQGRTGSADALRQRERSRKRGNHSGAGEKQRRRKHGSPPRGNRWPASRIKSTQPHDPPRSLFPAHSI